MGAVELAVPPVVRRAFLDDLDSITFLERQFALTRAIEVVLRYGPFLRHHGGHLPSSTPSHKLPCAEVAAPAYCPLVTWRSRTSKHRSIRNNRRSSRTREGAPKKTGRATDGMSIPGLSGHSPVACTACSCPPFFSNAIPPLSQITTSSWSARA